MTGHDFSPHTGWCRRCGAGRADVRAGLRSRDCEPGVRGISHIRRPMALRLMAKRIGERMRAPARPDEAPE